MLRDTPSGEGLNQSCQFSFGNAGSQRKAQTRAALRNGGRANGAHGKAFALQEGRGIEGGGVGTENDGNDLAGGLGDIEARRVQGAAKTGGTMEQIVTLGVHLRSDAEGSSNLSGEIWRKSGAEDEGTRVVDQMLLEFGGSTDESAARG